MYLLLNAETDNFLAIFATVCSSFVGINVGTSKRSLLLPEGDTSLAYIKVANMMLER